MRAPFKIPPVTEDGATPAHVDGRASGEVLLSVRGLTCSLSGRDLWRIRELYLYAGEALAVTGPTGIGKTLLLRTLAGLRPANRGEIRFDGKSLDRWRMPDYRSRVLYLAQKPALPEGTVEQALAAPFALRVHQHRRFSRERAREILRDLDLAPSFLEQETSELSGGEVQIAALTRALLIEPVILLLDEPTASLDAARTGKVEALLHAWLEGADRRALLWVSHDRAQVERVADRIMALAPA